jgi:D-alanine--poly(phosphoribitol) ligase subunit 2
MVERTTSIILTQLREHLESTGTGLPDLGPDTPLLGRNGVVDSLGLVSVIVAVEQAIADELGLNVSLADERAFSQKSSPFRTVGTLAAYAAEVVTSAV